MKRGSGGPPEHGCSVKMGKVTFNKQIGLFSPNKINFVVYSSQCMISQMH